MMLAHRSLWIVLFTSLVSGCTQNRQRLPAADPQIEQMLSEVDSKRIESNIRTLASFHTRHTLSDDPSQLNGIVAAREWIKAQFDQYSRDSGGRLTVEFQETLIE